MLNSVERNYNISISLLFHGITTFYCRPEHSVAISLVFYNINKHFVTFAIIFLCL